MEFLYQASFKQINVTNVGVGSRGPSCWPLVWDIVWLILISWGCLTSPTFFLQWIILIGPSKKKLTLWRLPQNKRFYWKMEYLPLWPTYIGEKGRTLGKIYGIKWGAIGKTLGENVGNFGNLMGTHWELEGNIEGTCWETKVKWKKTSSHPLHPKLKRKKSRHLECMLQPTNWLHVFFISKAVGHHFWPRLMAGGRDWTRKKKLWIKSCPDEPDFHPSFDALIPKVVKFY
jgi:hypothetical protein